MLTKFQVYLYKLPTMRLPHREFRCLRGIENIRVNKQEA